MKNSKYKNLPVYSRQNSSFLPLWVFISSTTLTTLFSYDVCPHCKTLSLLRVGPHFIHLWIYSANIMVGSERSPTVASINGCWINLDQRTLKVKKLKWLAKDHTARTRTKPPNSTLSPLPHWLSQAKKKDDRNGLLFYCLWKSNCSSFSTEATLPPTVHSDSRKKEMFCLVLNNLI